MTEDTLAIEVIREFDQVSSERGTWESHWQEIAERVLPSHSNSFNANSETTPGGKRTDNIFDSTASIALDRFGAILDSMVTPRNAMWHRLLPSDPYLLKRRPVRLWFEEATRVLFKYRYAPKANFSSQNQQVYLSSGAFGTGSLFVDGLKGEPGLRYRNIHLGEIYFVENHQGVIDKAYRYFPYSARQAVQKWGKTGKLPEAITTAAEKTPEKKFYFIHCVKPNEDRQPGRLDYRGRQFIEYYVSKEGKVTLETGGYNTFPYPTSRYSQAPGEVYGRGPAMAVLPAIKTLNEQKKTVLKQGHRTVDPVLLAHDDGVVDGFDLKPGALNIGGVSADGKPLVQTLPIGRVDIGKELMDDERLVINDAFLVTLFQILVDTPTMTATEVLERTREKGILLAPALGRIQSEYLGPLIEREIDVLARQGLLPPMPPELKEAGGEYTVEYDSPLSLSQRAGEAAGFMRTLQTVTEVVNVTQDPSPLDHFNFDTALPAIADIQGVPVSWMNPPDKILATRADRQKQQQIKQVTDALPGVAAMTKAAATTQQAQ